MPWGADRWPPIAARRRVDVRGHARVEVTQRSLGRCARAVAGVTRLPGGPARPRSVRRRAAGPLPVLVPVRETASPGGVVLVSPGTALKGDVKAAAVTLLEFFPPP